MNEYDHLCGIMTSREDVNYQEVKKRLVELMYTRGVAEINNLRNGIYSGCGKFIKISFDINFLLDKFREIYEQIYQNIEDSNHVGLINVFAFQFAALVSLPYRNDNPRFYSKLDPLTTEDLHEVINGEYIDVKNYILEKYPFSIETESADDRDTISEYTSEVLMDKNFPIFFFRWLDGPFSTEKILEEYFDRIYYCEIVGKASFADGECEEPLGFLLHDLFHGTETEMYCIPYRKEGSLRTPTSKQSFKNGVYKKDLKQLEKIRLFYNYCKTNMNPTKLKQIRTILFYQIHEDKCFVDLMKKRVTDNIDFIVEERFHDDKDLKMAIPRQHRNTKITINDYLRSCLVTYHEEYTNYMNYVIQKIHSRKRNKLKSWDAFSRKLPSKKTF
jgi:hypothetical protein